MGDIYFDDLNPQQYSQLMTKVCTEIDPYLDSDLINSFSIMSLRFDYITSNYDSVHYYIANKIILLTLQGKLVSDRYINRMYFCLENTNISINALVVIKKMIKNYINKVKAKNIK